MLFISICLVTIKGAVRETISPYPLVALREAANALIHQDFSITGTSVKLEIFSDRIEITNSGIPLVDILRIVDNPPIMGMLYTCLYKIYSRRVFNK